ncbi:type II secretion system F family protein [Occultella aeris]|uniref:Bacterial type II secretion system protein F domain protein n=1 Tax=Occultella aeris TaxID=2761496 RepID=A0A7M4DM64_9MICO|nr:type II secretion system F family protein [Occultella aeris]VZO38396.1 Bacterial type II secretion system protein F domain protein [Occultella aeris]
MGTVAGLLLGVGLLCIWWSFWPQQQPRQRRSTQRGERTQDLLVQAGMPGVRPAAFYGTSVAIGLVTFVVAAAVTGSPTIAASFAVLVALAPGAYVRSRARRRRTELRELWPEVVDDLNSGIRAGMSLPEALIGLSERGPEPMRAEFRAFADDYRATGRFSDALDRLKARLADPVADRLIEALRLTRDVGGTDLGRLLRTLSAFLRDDLRARGELEARQSWTVNGARLAAGAPWLVLALLSTRPETAAAFNTALGAAVLLCGAAASAAAYLLMVRIGRLPEDVRVLR